MPLYRHTADHHEVFPFLFHEDGSTLLMIAGSRPASVSVKRRDDGSPDLDADGKPQVILDVADPSVIETDRPIMYPTLAEVTECPAGHLVHKITVDRTTGNGFEWPHKPDPDKRGNRPQTGSPAVQRRLS